MACCYMAAGLQRAYCQNQPNGRIEGRILQGQSRKPLPDFRILLMPSRQVTITDAKGAFAFEGLAADKMQLQLRSPEGLDSTIILDFSPPLVRITILWQEAALGPLVIRDSTQNGFGLLRLNAIEGTIIYAGKKNEVIKIADLNANLATNNPRQLFSRIPGLNIWESDGAGIQLGIGARGLSPNRTSNFNTRLNGYDMTGDAFGYPESYYSPPAEAVERIEVVRGAASLQYGTQFGGMINFMMRQGDTESPLAIRHRMSIGSFGFRHIYLEAGGSHGKLNYYGLYQHRTGDGWRPNSNFAVHTGYGAVRYQVNPNLKVGFDLTYMQYEAQQAGGLTDQLFLQDARKSIRERNWFSVGWLQSAVHVDYTPATRWRFNSRSFGLMAHRYALGFLGNINRTDPGTNRDVIIDYYRNWGNETRLLHIYSIGNQAAMISGGIRFYRGFSIKQQGEGSANKDADFRFNNPNNLEGSDFNFPSQNVALFAEHLFQINSRWAIVPGVRWELIETLSDGYYRFQFKDLAGNILVDERINESKYRGRNFILAGIGSTYRIVSKTGSNIEAYANWSQNYRAVTFSDIRVINPNLQVDPNIQDERGYNADLGLRGNWNQLLNFDCSLFYLAYNDRIGIVQRVNPTTFDIFQYRTNVADAYTAGFEGYAEVNLWPLFFGPNPKYNVSIFSNLSLIRSRYIGSQESAFRNRQVEMVPAVVSRSGLNIQLGRFRTGFQYSYTSEQFTDATNARRVPNAVNGLVPAYWVVDWTASLRFNRFSFHASANNLTDNRYFTRRAASYPGPGIIPSDGRAFFFTFELPFRPFGVRAG
jgi:Fe(3+) dicitrate transport protein